ncbi:MAG: hypothetical protein ABSH06_20445 [Thermodesulfobacteriota bacterium]
MKKRNQSFSAKLKPVVLYFDDLEKIIEILKEISNDLEISTKDYQFENIEEVKKIERETINSLSFDTHRPGLSLTLEPDGIFLHVFNETPALRGIFEILKQFLHSRRRKFAWLYNPICMVFGGAIIGIATWFLLPGISKKNPYLISVGCACIILGVIYWWWTWQVDFKRYSTIFLKRRAELPSFWKDKRDQIIVAIISAVIGSLITVVATKLLH